MNQLRRFLESEDGPTSVEYAVMLAMILGAIITAISVMGMATLDSYEYSRDEMDRVFPTSLDASSGN